MAPNERQLAKDYLSFLYESVQEKTMEQRQIHALVKKLGKLGTDPKIDELWKGYLREQHQVQKLDAVRDFDDTYRQMVELTESLADDMPEWDRGDMAAIQLYAVRRDVEKALRERSLLVGDSPVFGVLPTGQPNGMAILVPGSRCPVIALEQGMVSFIHISAQCIVACFPFSISETRQVQVRTQGDGWKEKIRNNDWLVGQFAEFLENYAVRGFADVHKLVAPEPHHALMAGSMMRSAQTFVVSHEYAHLLKGHLTERSQRAPANVGNVKVEEIRKNWNQEYEADSLGFILMAETLHQLVPFYHAMGTGLFLAAVDILSRCFRTLETGEEATGDSPTHPPNAERATRLAELMGEFAGDKEEVRRLFRLPREILEFLWASVRPRVEVRHRSGQRPFYSQKSDKGG